MVEKKRETLEDFVGWRSEDDLLEVVEVVEKSKYSKFKVICHKCKEDEELFPDGYFISHKYSLIKGYKPCGCAKYRKWSEYEYLVLAKRASTGRFIVHGFVGEFKNQNSKLSCECLVDGYKWEPMVNGIVNSSSGCPKCANNLRFSEQEALDTCIKICKSRGYFPVGFNSGYQNQRSRFTYECPLHGLQDMSYHSFSSGLRGCPCCSKNGYNPSKYGVFYISRWWSPTSSVSFVKFGITNNSQEYRMKVLQRNTGYKYEIVYARGNPDGRAVLDLENTIKDTDSFYTGVIDKVNFKRGFTETVESADLERLMAFADDYFDNIEKRG